MESYIVRIYRRDPEDPQKSAGLVEVVNTEETRPFSDARELVEIICPAVGDRHPASENGKRRRL